MTNEHGELPPRAESGERALVSPGDVDLAAIRNLQSIAAALGAARVQADAAALAERLVEGRFHLACVGEFKRGKSSLINALVGAAVLPTGLVPVTAVTTVIRYGHVTAARVRLARRAWESIPVTALSAFVSEAENPENAKGVEAVEVFVPAPLLRDGLCLVDTAGIGSVFEGNTAATRAFVPHIDAALVVVGVDPPISGDELDLVEEVARTVPNILVVLNKADRFSDAERAEAVAFAHRVLTVRLRRAVEPVYEVSAAERLNGTGPPRDWPTFTAALAALVTESGRSILRAAQDRGITRLAAQLEREIGETRDALWRPMAESERRLDLLRRTIGDVAHRSLQLGHLLAAEQEALARRFADRRGAFLASARPLAAAELTAAIDGSEVRRGPALRRRAIDHARSIAAIRLTPWLTAEQKSAESAYRQIATRFIGLANGFLERLSGLDDPVLRDLPHVLDAEAGFRTSSRFYFHDLQTLAHRASPARWWLDRLRPPGAARRAIRRDVLAYLDQLMDMNATRVQNDLDERVAESRRRLEADIRAVLDSVYTTAERALARARTTQEQGESAVQRELERLGGLAARLQLIARPSRPDPTSP